MNHSLHLIMQLFFRPLQFPEKQDQKALFFIIRKTLIKQFRLSKQITLIRIHEKALKRKIA